MINWHLLPEWADYVFKVGDKVKISNKMPISPCDEEGWHVLLSPKVRLQDTYLVDKSIFKENSTLFVRPALHKVEFKKNPDERFFNSFYFYDKDGNLLAPLRKFHPQTITRDSYKGTEYVEINGEIFIRYNQ
jgi:hypothetical protein